MRIRFGQSVRRMELSVGTGTPDWPPVLWADGGGAVRAGWSVERRWRQLSGECHHRTPSY
jgi:hypothetical protein